MFAGVDVGGTFTDLVIFDEESKRGPEVVKIPTIPRQPEKAVLEALSKYPDITKRVVLVSHATTIATNALLTHSGLAKTALITNQGFRDILEIGRQRRSELYNLQTKRPTPLVERKNRFTVTGRTLPDGSNLEPLAEKEVRKIAGEIIKERFESVAIVLLNSHVNPEQERRTEGILRQQGFKGHVDISSDIDRQYREYERTSTTVVNASLAPLMSRYLVRFEKELERIGFHCPVYVMNSDGTSSTIAQASQRPISMIESGPAAGVLASKTLASVLSQESNYVRHGRNNRKSRHDHQRPTRPGLRV